MGHRIQQLKLVSTNKSERIAAEILALQQANMCGYIEATASELSAMAAGFDQQRLRHLLNLAVAEAKSHATICYRRVWSA